MQNGPPLAIFKATTANSAGSSLPQQAIYSRAGKLAEGLNHGWRGDGVGDSGGGTKVDPAGMALGRSYPLFEKNLPALLPHWATKWCISEATHMYNFSTAGRR